MKIWSVCIEINKNEKPEIYFKSQSHTMRVYWHRFTLHNLEFLLTLTSFIKIELFTFGLYIDFCLLLFFILRKRDIVETFLKQCDSILDCNGRQYDWSFRKTVNYFQTHRLSIYLSLFHNGNILFCLKLTYWMSFNKIIRFKSW